MDRTGSGGERRQLTFLLFVYEQFYRSATLIDNVVTNMVHVVFIFMHGFKVCRRTHESTADAILGQSYMYVYMLLVFLKKKVAHFSNHYNTTPVYVYDKCR